MDKESVEPKIKEPQAIVCLKDGKLAVMEKSYCHMLNSLGKIVHSIESREYSFFDIAIDKDKTLLALSRNFDDPIIYHATTNQETKLEIKQHTCYIPTDFSPKHNSFFFQKNGHLFSYNINNKQIKYCDFSLPYSGYATDIISCNSLKNEIMYASSDRKLTTIQSHPAMATYFIKHHFTTDFKCNSAVYAPNGHTIAIISKEDPLFNPQLNCFICDLADKENPLIAHQLISDNKDYIACKFHPHYHWIALLSTDNHVHIFDYIKQILIAAKQLPSTRAIPAYITYITKRLDFDEAGTKLFVAFSDTWKAIEIPNKKHLSTAMLALYEMLPKELRKIIMYNVLSTYTYGFDFLDIEALLNTWAINISPQEPNESDNQSETREIKAAYKRPKENFAYDHASEELGF
jgi:WD40 repeat protein